MERAARGSAEKSPSSKDGIGLHKFAYEPLDASKNEIRLLLLSPHPHQTAEQNHTSANQFKKVKLRFSLVNVSLDDFSEHSQAFRDAHGSDRVPQDDYFQWIDLCRTRAGLHPLMESDKAELTRIWGRWIWGDFLAISYVWGGMRDRRAVEINGHMFPVTDKLYDILEWFHDGPMRLNLQLLNIGIWVDAICINQEDTKEKSLQVKRMGAVYNEAFNTFAWLGNGKRESNLNKGIDLLKMFAREYEILEEIHDEESAQSRKALFLQSIKALDDQYLIALGNFFCSPYWNRVWIIQEIAISSPSISFVFENNQLTFLDLVRAMGRISMQRHEILEIYKTMCTRTGYEDESERVSMQINHIGKLLNSQGMGGYKSSEDLLQLMGTTSRAQQKDEKDKIYSVLSLFDSNISNAIKPDYGNSVTWIYTEFVRVVIQHTECLDIICGVRPCLDIGINLPSWVPDWRVKSRTDMPIISDVPYHASKNQRAEVTFPQEGVLSAMGFVFDMCDGLSVDVDDIKRVKNEGTAVTLTTANLHRSFGNSYETYDRTREALWKTMVANRGNTGGAPPSFESLLLIPSDEDCAPLPNITNHRSYASYRYYREMNSHLTLGGVPLKEFYSSPSLRGCPLPEKDICEAMDMAISYSFGRKLVVTMLGYLGLASTLAQHGNGWDN